MQPEQGCRSSCRWRWSHHDLRKSNKRAGLAAEFAHLGVGSTCACEDVGHHTAASCGVITACTGVSIKGQDWQQQLACTLYSNWPVQA